VVYQVKYIPTTDMKERTILIIKLVSTHLLLLPILVLICLISKRYSIILISITFSVLMILLLSGYWEFFGLRFKRIYVLASTLILAAILLLKIFSFHPAEQNIYLSAFFSVLQLCLLFQIIKIFIVIIKPEKGATEIEFPFRNGKYLITDGGNSKISRLMNYHYYSPVHIRNKTNRSMLFATDIVRLNGCNSNFFPPQNEEYPIFGEKVYSPVSGVVIKVENGIPDNNPYSGNYPYNTGNTIVIKNDNRYLLLGHLKKESIKVKSYDKVNAGDLIAEAGNSGYSERPHIHIQLIESSTDNYWKGAGISILFMGKNLYKNKIIDI
jgi:Peptidase family M23